MNPELTIELREKINQKVSAKFPDFDKEWSKYVNGIGIEFVSSVKEILKKQIHSFQTVLNISLNVVVDNNFIFGNVKKIIQNKENLDTSFIIQLCKCDLIKFYAPPKLKDELFEKINEYIFEEKELAISYAETILNYITIKDAEWIADWKRANNLIGHIDEDDVPYLALAFDIGGHSLISYDKVFQNQNDVQIWDQKDIGKIVTSYNRGSVALVVLGSSTLLIWNIIKFVSFILKTIFEIIVQIFSVIFKLIASIPAPFLLSGAILFAFFCNETEEGKEFVRDIKENGKEYIKEYLRQWHQSIGKVLELINTLKKSATPAIINGFDILGFLAMEYLSLDNSIKEIELNKTKSSFN